ncbi:MAG: acyl-CoA thioesterase II [Hyphomicrobiales bacterium]|nr:acyl-CoA thioesterase II [Hyphomicrobiales bacterium]MCP5372274.1 acyl-CoA thioesterase II [Hyphomicrobiales bacterium]
MTDALANLIALLDLEVLEADLFRGRSPQESRQRVFGGHVIGQALVAATRTVEGRQPHSLHAYFLRPGDPRVPIIYDVDCIRDGTSFTTRRVLARQHGRAIYSMSVSFQVPEDGLDHQMPMPDVPAPEDLPPEAERRAAQADRIPEAMRAWYLHNRAIETRPIDPPDPMAPGVLPPVRRYWVRTTAPLPADAAPALHQCVLAYASDMTLLETCLAPHAMTWYSARLQAASLDHAMWFHRPFRADDWLLFDQQTPSTSAARGFNFGNVYRRDGALVASMAQEGLIRPRKG